MHQEKIDTDEQHVAETFAEKMARGDIPEQARKKAPRLKRGASNTDPGEYQPSSGDDPSMDERERRVGHTLLRLCPWRNQEELDTENNSREVLVLKRDFEMCWQVREAFRKGFYHQKVNRLHDFVENTLDLLHPAQWVEDIFIQRLGGENSEEYLKNKRKRVDQFETEVDYSVGIDGFETLPFWRKERVTQHACSMCLEHVFGYLGSDIKSFGPGISMTKVTELDDMLNYIDLAVKVEPGDGDSSGPCYLGIDVTISEGKSLGGKVSGEIDQIKSGEVLDFIGPVMFDGQAVESDASFLPLKICLDKKHTMKLIESFYNEVVCGVVKGNESQGPKIPEDVESYVYIFLDEIVQQLDLFEAILLDANPVADSVLGRRLVVVQRAHTDFKNKLNALSLKKTPKIVKTDESYKIFKKSIGDQRKKYPAAA